MSKFERKYTWKHIVVAVVLFAVAGSINLIPRHSVVSSPCTPGSNSKQTVKVTSLGLPFTHAKKYEATSICLVFKNGKYVNPAATQPKQELNIGALIVNELLIVLLVMAGVVLVSSRKVKK